MTGGCAISQVGFAYITIVLLTRFGLERTLRVLGGVMALICLIASQFYLPVSYEHNQQNSVTSNKRGVLFYIRLLRNKQFAMFVFASFILSFAFGISSVHQVGMKFNLQYFSVGAIYYILQLIDFNTSVAYSSNIIQKSWERGFLVILY